MTKSNYVVWRECLGNYDNTSCLENTYHKGGANSPMVSFQMTLLVGALIVTIIPFTNMDGCKEGFSYELTKIHCLQIHLPNYHFGTGTSASQASSWFVFRMTISCKKLTSASSSNTFIFIFNFCQLLPLNWGFPRQLYQASQWHHEIWPHIPCCPLLPRV